MAHIKTIPKEYNPRKPQICCIIHIRFEHDETNWILMSPLTSWLRVCSLRGVLDIGICDKVVSDLRQIGVFCPDSPVSPTNKTGRHDIIEMLLKVVLRTIKPAKLLLNPIHTLLSYNLYRNYCPKTNYLWWKMNIHHFIPTLETTHYFHLSPFFCSSSANDEIWGCII